MPLLASETLAKIGEVQSERVRVLPKKLADNPLRTLALDAYQSRNAALDVLFYDVASITKEETHHLAVSIVHEGDILLVPPTGEGSLSIFRSVEDFLGQGPASAALAVAGVGSSSLGAAAFARNVADALGRPVAAVVSGYGLADVLTEALGGFFFFGGLNSLRHLFESLDTASLALSRSFLNSGEATLERSEGLHWVRTSEDTRTVLALLKDPRFAPDLLIGHSKGNLVISEALYALVSEASGRAASLAAASRIVTVSAKIGMPEPFYDVFDIMGQYDLFGLFNSRLDLETDYVVPQAWHSTNPDFAWPGLGRGIHVAPTLKTVLAMTKSAGRSGTPALHGTAAAVLDLPQRFTAALHRPAFDGSQLSA
ncbi:hypothetical protein MPPM_1035 [Methylorubrum populi]|uniref:Uncharacterized protein n=1 Tax=Methylorubrum populi TaxID=223967 RepID=A0A160PEC1_9HYPH|nr:hypothetical protein [Methylorubrum populi]BAU89640.1 hypothetical protein MPPM_1035 [Methylorubrum populi]